jgi:hypothetical protein
MRLAKGELDAYGNDVRGNSKLAEDAVAYLGHHRVTAGLHAQVLAMTIRDLFLLNSLSSRINEITGYLLAIQRIQLVRGIVDRLQKHFSDQVPDIDSSRNTLNLENLVFSHLPSPLESSQPEAVGALQWTVSQDRTINIPAELIGSYIGESQKSVCGTREFVAACFFLHVPVSKKPPYEFIDGALPLRFQTKKKRQHLDMRDPEKIDWLLDRMSRPLHDRGEIAYKHAKSGYNYLLNERHLDQVKQSISAWIKTMRDKGRPFHIRDIMRDFSITYRQYIALEEQMTSDTRNIRHRRAPTFILHQKLLKRLEAYANKRGITIQQALNEIVGEYFDRENLKATSSFMSTMVMQGLTEDEDEASHE